MPRWNLRKAKWEDYTSYMEKNINRIPPLPENYPRFVKLVKKAASTAIPRGHRQNYIPCWNREYDSLLKEYKHTGDGTIANQLIKSLDNERRNRWITAMDNMDFTHSSRKSWELLRKLGAAQPSRKNGNVTANAISSIINKTSNIKPNKHEKSEVKRKFKECEDRSELASDFTPDEVQTALKLVKNGKAAGADGILPEFLKNVGPKCINWIAKLATEIGNYGKIPKLWLESKVIAILKPNKDASDPNNYRPISLLSTMYKLFERLLLARLQPIVEKSLPLEQAGFRQNRNCCDQVLAITTHVENGFQQKAKSGALFLDLSSAYDTVWTRGLFLKIAKIIRCKATILLLEKMISNRKFRVTHGGKTSRYKILQNGLPQGAVLSPMLFNIYTADMTDTMSRKFIYADDVALVTQATSFEEIESVLNADVAKVK